MEPAFIRYIILLQLHTSIDISSSATHQNLPVMPAYSVSNKINAYTLAVWGNRVTVSWQYLLYVKLTLNSISCLMCDPVEMNSLMHFNSGSALLQKPGAFVWFTWDCLLLCFVKGSAMKLILYDICSSLEKRCWLSFAKHGQREREGQNPLWIVKPDNNFPLHLQQAV